MRIAVLMVGRIASFEKCYKSHYENIFNGNEVDIYLAHNANNITDNIELFKTLYNVKKIVSLKVDISEYEKYRIRSNIGVNGRNCIIMFSCLNEAFKLIDGVYDIVLYMRADELMYNKIIFKTPRENTIYIPMGNDHLGGINDQFAYGDYESMKKYCSTIENLHMFLSTNQVIFHPENINRYNLYHNNLQIERFPLDYSLFKLPIIEKSKKTTFSILNILRKIRVS